MSMNKILGAATSFALIAAIGGTAVAQTATVQLPAELEALGLTNVRNETNRDGSVDVEGVTADGLEVDATVDASGKLLEADVDRGAMPQSLVDAILPEAARSNDVMSQFAKIDSIEQNNDGTFEVQGDDSTGKEYFALFGADGAVLRSGQDD